MPLPKGAYYRVRTYPSGKRVRLAISSDDRILEEIPISSKSKKTRTGKRLNRRRRRIGL